MYIIPTVFFDESDGVTKKAKQQIAAFTHNGYDVDVVSYDNTDIVFCEYREGTFRVCDRLNSTRQKRRNALFSYARRRLAPKEYDTCYIRYPYASLLFVKMLKEFKKFKSVNILEVPTYPIPHPLEKGVRGVLGRMIYAEEKLCVRRLKKYIDRIYSMGEPVDYIFGVKNVNIPNGIEISCFRPRVIKKDDNAVHILYCGSLFDYQGVDRLINGIKVYNQADTENKTTVIAEIVGDGPKMAEWSELAQREGLQNFVIFHGYLSGDKLDAVVDRCDIACSLLAAHRGGIVNASPLKTKEYMARGIPFIYSYNENNMAEDVDFALRIESDETPIDIRKILAFYNTYVSRQESIVERMREYVERNFSWEHILKDI